MMSFENSLQFGIMSLNRYKEYLASVLRFLRWYLYITKAIHCKGNGKMKKKIFLYTLFPEAAGAVYSYAYLAFNDLKTWDWFSKWLKRMHFQWISQNGDLHSIRIFYCRTVLWIKMIVGMIQTLDISDHILHPGLSENKAEYQYRHILKSLYSQIKSDKSTNCRD